MYYESQKETYTHKKRLTHTKSISTVTNKVWSNQNGPNVSVTKAQNNKRLIESG